MKKLFVRLIPSLLIALSMSLSARAGTLVSDPFIDFGGSFNGWIDTWDGTTPISGPGPSWRLHMQNQTVMEVSDARQGDGPVARDGKFTPFILLKDDYTTPTNYTINAEMYTSDDELFGIVFGYTGPNDYFRLSMRQQTNGNLGGTNGVSIQKVVGGVVTQISPNGTGAGNTTIPTSDIYLNHKPINVSIAVTGTTFTATATSTDAANNPIQVVIPITDANLAAGKVGIQSWGERSASTAPIWGVEVNNFSVQNSTGGVEFNETFDVAQPVAFRPLYMQNSLGLVMSSSNANAGNFAYDFQSPRITDSSNSFEYASGTTGNFNGTDFLGSAIVVDDPGSESMTDYEMKVRIQNEDNDGIGILFRVTDDDSFYRANFGVEGLSTSNDRNPRGLSIQKCIIDPNTNTATWTEIFRDDQTNPIFLFTPGSTNGVTPGVPFDLSLKAVGDTFKIDIIDDPDGAATPYSYPLITDSTDPILAGSVGFTQWGSGFSGVGSNWSAYGGQIGTPLVTSIPEPSTIALCLIGAIGMLYFRKKS